MRGQRYRMKTPTLAIIHAGWPQGPFVTIPKGAEIEVPARSLNGDGLLVDVTWDGKAVTMSSTDIRERGERLDGASG